MFVLLRQLWLSAVQEIRYQTLGTRDGGQPPDCLALQRLLSALLRRRLFSG